MQANCDGTEENEEAWKWEDMQQGNIVMSRIPLELGLGPANVIDLH